MRAFTEAILFPLVVTVSSCSTLSGCALAVMCVSAARQTRGHSADAHAAKSLQLLLGFLGVADALFAVSFLVAQLPTGWRGSESGGPACLIAATLNDVGALGSALFTAALAWALHCALVLQGRHTVRLARLALPLSALVWVSIAIFETSIWLAFYEPRGALAPNQVMPWCHWRRGTIWVSVSLYSIIILVCVYLLAVYAHIAVHTHRRLRSALATALHPATGDDSCSLTTEELDSRLQSALYMRSRALALDVRLSSYLLAYILSQLPSVVHRMWQASTPGSTSPEWLAIAQSATQPAQGLLNLLVFSHHSRRPSTDRSSWDLGCGECVRRWCSGTRRNRGSTNSAYQ